MKFIITADIHFGSRNDQGFSMQTKYTEQAPELVHALGQAAVEQGAEFIIHAGDMITYGTAEEIKTAGRVLCAPGTGKIMRYLCLMTASLSTRGKYTARLQQLPRK